MADEPNQEVKLPGGMTEWKLELRFLCEGQLPVALISQEGLPSHPAMWGAMCKLVDSVLLPGWLKDEMKRREAMSRSQIETASPEVLERLRKANVKPGETIIGG